MMASNYQLYIENAVKRSRVVMFSKSTDSLQAKDLLDSKGIAYHSIVVDAIPEGDRIEATLYHHTGQRTVPQIFIDQQFVGGFSELEKLNSSRQLDAIIKGETDMKNVAYLKFVEESINNNAVTIYTKSTGLPCAESKETLNSKGVAFREIAVDLLHEGDAIKAVLYAKTGHRTLPQIFIGKQLIKGNDALQKLDEEGKLDGMLTAAVTAIPKAHPYDYDLIVIGGGSGGMAASKEAALLGAKVALFDFVKQSPAGTTWGLGGTCVNVGCIPKKLMHTSALLADHITDASSYGWKVDGPLKYGHKWAVMKNGIQDHIGSINWNYRVSLRDNRVDYLNSYARFVDAHKIEGTDKKGRKKEITANKILIATGMRPKYPRIPGAKEYSITSDDLFSLDYNPGKTLLVGASYVSLECGGFLHGLGLDVTIMVRSILLRGFDQEMAERIGGYMEEHGVKFVRPAVPTKVEQIAEGKPGRLRVTAKYVDGDLKGQEITEEYNTVIFAIGREPVYGDCNFQAAGLKVNRENNKIPVNYLEQTNVPHIYAVGDVLDGKLELTPVAIQAGLLLARRLFGGSTKKMDYDNVPTTVFTPLEYGACGLSEETAISRYGEENIEVYHTTFTPLEWTVPHRASDENPCFMKLICLKTEKERVLGLHYLGPNAGEVTQGYAVAIKRGATKEDFDETVGIHPTNSEVFTVLDVTKASGQPLGKSSC